MADACNHMHLEFVIHVVSGSFPKIEERIFIKFYILNSGFNIKAYVSVNSIVGTHDNN